jgi:hypothetical protein
VSVPTPSGPIITPTPILPGEADSPEVVLDTIRPPVTESETETRTATSATETETETITSATSSSSVPPSSTPTPSSSATPTITPLARPVEPSDYQRPVFTGAASPLNVDHSAGLGLVAAALAMLFA